MLADGGEREAGGLLLSGVKGAVGSESFECFSSFNMRPSSEGFSVSSLPPAKASARSARKVTSPFVHAVFTASFEPVNLWSLSEVGLSKESAMSSTC